MLLLLPLLGCPASTGSFALDVEVFDCDALCWNDGTIDVPLEHWRAWAEQSACDDAGLFLTYGDELVATRQTCDSSWADDPMVGDAAAGCGGALDIEVIMAAPGCDG